MNTRTGRWLAVILYCTAIFVQSGRPVSVSLPAWPGSDKVLHFFAYALLGVLFFRAFAATRVNDPPGRVVVWSILAAALYGLSDEVHQAFVPSRSAQWLDAAADALGAAAGVGLWSYWFAKPLSPPMKPSETSYRH